MNLLDSTQFTQFVDWFRQSSGYIHAFRGKTFVLTFGGEAVSDPNFANLVHDIALLNALGIKLVIVYDAQPQVSERLSLAKIVIGSGKYGPIVDDRALPAVKDAAAAVRLEIEALLSMGLANSPMAGARIRVVSGNFVIAKPLGVREGIDYRHTGEVRRVDTEAIQTALASGAIVLLSPLGYSPTGEVFSLTALAVATAAARALSADKLLCLTELGHLPKPDGQSLRQLSLPEAEGLLANTGHLAPAAQAYLAAAVNACRAQTVRRTHLIDRRINGALLLELFTRDGIGTMVAADIYETIRRATIEDLGGILELIAPLEVQGVLVKRSREQLELEIDNFYVIDRDGMVIGCAALFPYLEEHVAELACLVVHPNYQRSGRGDALLTHVEHTIKQAQMRRVFLLTTHALHWFRERGFVEVERSSLPVRRQALYNAQRNSKILEKVIPM